jgi:CheY-like chemotaxis protein
MSRLATFLVVEDNELDVEKLRRCFRRNDIGNPMRHAADGYEALDILRGTNGVKKLDEPFVMLLDLNMPRMSGLELLEELRADPQLQGTRVFVMTTSDHRRDVEAAYRHNVAGYIVKPAGVEKISMAVQMLSQYCDLCLPPAPGAVRLSAS